ncbi:MAG: hypothetical protein V4547_19520 [Bacteroidota bacterium]
MKSFELFYLDFSPFRNDLFSEDYIKWITQTAIKNKCNVEFKDFSILITGKSQVKICMTLLFIGYAYGMMENGR